MYYSPCAGSQLKEGGALPLHCRYIAVTGTQLKEGGAVRFVRIYDEFKMKYRAAEVSTAYIYILSIEVSTHTYIY